MCPGGEGLLHYSPAGRTRLTGIGRVNSNRYPPKHTSEVFKPYPELVPPSISDGFLHDLDGLGN